MKLTTKRLCIAALLTALTAVISQIALPLPFSGVPVTLQIFAVALCGYLLGPLYGSLSIALYIGLGLCGVPVFAGFNTGIGAITGPTGGFILGFIILTLLCGVGSRLKRVPKYILGIFGLVLCHLCGITYYSFLTRCGFFTALLSVSLPYILKDILLTLGAAEVAQKIKRVL